MPTCAGMGQDHITRRPRGGTPATFRADPPGARDEYWVFGYGSLMWRPGFDHLEAVPARLFGYHRAFCVYSHVHRGTPERPGLVLGLDRGGSCRGMAFRVAPQDWSAVTDYLREREQVTAVYQDIAAAVALSDPARPPRLRALTFIADRTHHQYAGVLSVEAQADLVLSGHGRSGPNVEYLERTLAHLEELGVHDANLTAVQARVRALRPNRGA